MKESSLLEKLRQESSKIARRIIEIRRKIHSYPELKFEEKRTSLLIAKELALPGMKIKEGVAGTGVIGELQGKGEGPVVGLRADMDCVRVEETTGLPFASRRKGLMHACGHDGHVAMLLGAARILSKYRDEFSGRVRFIFQPGEESGFGGKKMVEEGAVEGLDAIFGLHLWSSLETGKAMFGYGPFFSASSIFYLEVIGRGGHPSTPHLGVDAVYIAALIVEAIQGIVTRTVDTQEPVVVTVSEIKGGGFGTIPERCLIQGTIRTYDFRLTDRIIKTIEKVAKGLAGGFKARINLDYRRGYPPVVNDRAMTDFALSKAGEYLGRKKVLVAGKKIMGSEDFAYYLQKVPGSFFLLGTGKNKASAIEHSSEYVMDERVLPEGAGLLAYLALAYNREKKTESEKKSKIRKLS